ncbi:TNT domain-containing protein [Aeromicrobium sp.]|uniref:TNT domain-containing protein n=1 Tax=Aeromicrobium sp. TaxID=1871063 RepID=UPI0019923299|nr:TNT domain-containing protein [Aeromicrobium sp.]MBC7633918.1 TNT domain-containing protein [Aeromicrobium sp.]
MSTTDVVRLAGEAGAPTEMVFAAAEPDVIPRAPSQRWVVVPRSDGATTLGGMDRGRFAVYDTYETDELAANAVVHVLQPPQTIVVDAAAFAGLQQDAKQLAATLREHSANGSPLTPDMIPVGTALDHLGPSSGHCLFLLDTPFSERSAPPTDLELSRTVFLVRAPLGGAVSVGPVQPWFGQPGGGILVTLERPVRWYYDTGVVDVVAPR